MATHEIHHKIYDDKEGACITVCPFSDAPDIALCIMTADQRSKDYFGELYLSMDTDFAMKLGQALVQAATDFKKKS